MTLFYNTNGFAHHRLEEVVELLAEIGYGGIALTPDVPHLDWRTTSDRELKEFKRRCETAGLDVTIESGARFALDARSKHAPNLCSSAGFERRIEYYQRLLEYANQLESRTLSIWSGAAEPGFEPSTETLATRLKPVLDRARQLGVVLSFEPEPGMFIETIEQYRRLRSWTGSELALTIDVGHLLVSESPPYAERLIEASRELAVVHLDDAIVGVHEHRMIGEGDVPWPEILSALRRVGFTGPRIVELSRHSHDAARAARLAHERLRACGF